MQIYLMNFGTGTGAWITLPVEEEEIKDFITKNEISTPTEKEYIIADTNCDGALELDIRELDDVYYINELLHEYELLEEYEKLTVLAILEEQGNQVIDLENALIQYEDRYLAEGIDTEEELGAFLLEERIAEYLPEELLYYFDYSKYGKDMILSGEVTLTTYGALF